MSADLDHRSCQACGATLVQHPNESRSNWRRRQSCGRSCQRLRIQSTPRQCEHCGDTFTRNAPAESNSSFQKRRFCSKACGTAAFSASRERRDRAYRDSLLEDLEWIIGTDHPERVALRLGLTLDGLQRNLYRWGRTDLVARLSAEVAA